MDISKYMGEYLNAETAKEADIVEILDEGKESKIGEKVVINFSVLVNGKNLIYTPSKKAIKIMKAWGYDTKAWIGKKFQIKYVFTEMQGKDIIQLRPILIS